MASPETGSANRPLWHRPPDISASSYCQRHSPPAPPHANTRGRINPGCRYAFKGETPRVRAAGAKYDPRHWEATAPVERKARKIKRAAYITPDRPP